MTISILIPYKPGQPDRDRIWQWIERRYALLHSDCQLCVGFDDSLEFNRGEAINRAAKQAEGDVFIIADADTLVSPDQVYEVAAQAGAQGGLWVGFTGYKALNPIPTNTVLSLSPDSSIHFDDEDGTFDFIYQGSVSGCVAVTRQDFETVKGFPAEFQGWGHEDNAFCYKLETLTGKQTRRIEGDLYHLYHEKAQGQNPGSTTYRRNLERCELYGRAWGKPDEMRALIG